MRVYIESGAGMLASLKVSQDRIIRFGLASLLACSVGTLSCASRTSAEDSAQTGEDLQLAQSNYTLTLDTPADIQLLDVALAANGRLELEDNSVVAARGDTKPVVTNMGAGGTVIDRLARAGDVYSKSSVLLESDAHLFGSVFAPSLKLSPGARVDGATTTPATLDPATATTFTVSFPTCHGTNVFVGDNREATLPPGRYGEAVVDGTLTLGSGSYYFESVVVAERGAMTLRQKSGGTTVFIENRVDLHGAIASQANDGFALVQVSDGDIAIPNTFQGVVVAPNAALTLGTVSGSASAPPSHGWFGHWGSLWNPAKHGGDHDGDRDDEPTFTGAYYARTIRLGRGARLHNATPNFLAPILAPPTIDVQQCAALIRPDSTLTGAARDRAYQNAIARYCTMNGASSCDIDLTSRVNVDYTMAATALVGETMTPSQYLAVVRDRTRKKQAAESDSRLAEALCQGNDSDGDWVPDDRDKCPRTPALTATTSDGCTDSSLPAAPSAADLHQFFTNSGLMLNAACQGYTPIPRLPAGAFYFPGDRSKGTFILSGRAPQQPAGCPVWYFFDVEELNGASAVRSYTVAFKDSDESTALLGTSNPVPDGFIQFNPLPTSPSTQGQLGNAGGSGVRFRVQAMNGAGAKSGWSEWKLTTKDDCTALGFSCG
jgi:hypothetical protein